MQQPGQNREGERPEFLFRGPFGGIQVELPPHLIEQIVGLTDSTNFIFKHGMATVRPGVNTIAAFPAAGPANEQANGVINFYDLNGLLHQMVLTAGSVAGGRLLQWNGPSTGWTAIPPAVALTGTRANLFSYDTVAYKLCFSQGVDKIQLWDGIAGTFAVASANAPAARYLAEIANHLVTAYTTEGGVTFPQRVRWSGTGDPTDWTGVTAGVNDRLNNFGPITGLAKLYQQGFGFQQKGIFQIIPTGIGTNPFRIIDLGSRARGNAFPFSLDVFDERTAFYVGVDNVYGFDGTTSTGIGEFPLEGRQRQGAWGAISSDLQASNPATVIGAVTSQINGRRFNAYWLFIPGISCWLFSIDEGNWTRFTFAKTVSRADIFTNNGIIRIIDLVGTIAQQNWTPATLQSNNPFDNFFIGFTDGTPGMIDFTTYSEQPFNLTTGPLIMGDQRHEKTVNTVRVVYQDFGSVTATFTVSNEKGEMRPRTVTFGSGTGKMTTMLVNLQGQITGMYLTINVSGAASQPLSISELTPLYIVANESKATV